MTGAMYAAVAGLKAHMQNLNVIGNNVANVNTQGYKAGRSVFRTSIYTTLSGGSNGTATVGGRNPSQIGYGSVLSSVDIDMSTGTYNPSGKATDCMIDGDGFFMVGKKDIADNLYRDYVAADTLDPNGVSALTLTRVGNFEFKADGYLTNNLGDVAYGFLCTGYDPVSNEPIFSDQLVPIRVPGYDSATGDIKYPSEYEIKADDGTEDNTKIGQLHDAQRVIEDENGDPVVENGKAKTESYPKAKLTGISIDPATGIITGMSPDGKPVTVGCIAIGTVNNPNGVTQLSNTYYKAGEGSGTLTVNALGGAADRMKINRIFEKAYDAKLNEGNAGGDKKEPSSAIIDATTIAGGGDTALITSGLEASKTDLAQEISNMIVTQRGYQANTRIITVTDSMLEELVNMKR